MIDRKYGFMLKQTIDFSVQKAIVDGMRYVGEDHPLIHGPDQPACMKLLHLRTFDPLDAGCYQYGVPELNNFDEHDYDDFIYINRANPDIQWYWIDNPLTDLVKPEIEKLNDIYEYITRVTVLITNVGSEVPFHKEWMYGNRYDGIQIQPHQYFQKKGISTVPYEDRINYDMHRAQGYYACKIPLTVVEGNNGNSFFKFDDGRQVKYGAGNHMFCLNEISMKHGVLPTDFLRGVIYIDGKIRLDKLNEAFYAEFKELE